MSRRRASRWHGLLQVNKLPGPTSHDIVEMARKALGERRIGHTGTLDPAAQGLLLLCVGAATRLQEHLLQWQKTYHGVVQLGHATTTYDAEGKPSEPSGEPPVLEPAALRDLEARFSGKILQVPPSFSAKKVAGKKLYELARSGEQVEVEPKEVTVHDLRLASDRPGQIRLHVSSSSGFYVRSLAHDIGTTLGCGGHLVELNRLEIGPYTADTALSQTELESTDDAEQLIASQAWVPLRDLALPYSKITLNPTATDRFKHGQEVVVLRPGTEPLQADALVVVRSQGGNLVGIGRVVNVLARGRTVNIRPTRVLATDGGG